MSVCCCQLAGTSACDTCLNNPSKIQRGYYEFTPIYSSPMKEQLDKIMERINFESSVIAIVEENIRTYSNGKLLDSEIQDIAASVVKTVKKAYGV